MWNPDSLAQMKDHSYIFWSLSKLDPPSVFKYLTPMHRMHKSPHVCAVRGACLQVPLHTLSRLHLYI